MIFDRTLNMHLPVANPTTMLSFALWSQNFRLILGKMLIWTEKLSRRFINGLASERFMRLWGQRVCLEMSTVENVCLRKFNPWLINSKNTVWLNEQFVSHYLRKCCMSEFEAFEQNSVSRMCKPVNYQSLMFIRNIENN